MRKIDFFKFEDFKNACFYYGDAMRATDAANAKLIENAKMVYGRKDHCGVWILDHRQAAFDTHQALLINIQEIKRECEQHEPEMHKLFKEFGTDNAKCRHCGEPVFMKWEAKK